MNTFTAKVSRAIAYKQGMIKVKLIMKAEDVRSMGIAVDDGATVKIVQVKLQKYEWNSWREQDPDTFPKLFGKITFTLDCIEEKHLDADPLKFREDDLDWLEGVGFCPAGNSTGTVLLPEFDDLIQDSQSKSDAPRGF